MQKTMFNKVATREKGDGPERSSTKKYYASFTVRLLGGENKFQQILIEIKKNEMKQKSNQVIS